MATNAKAAKAEKPADAAAPKQGPDLVEMTKGGETLAVHPSCVKAHRSAGWSIKEV